MGIGNVHIGGLEAVECVLKDRFNAGFGKEYIVFSSLQLVLIFVLIRWYYNVQTACGGAPPQPIPESGSPNTAPIDKQALTNQSGTTDRVKIEPMNEKQVMLSVLTSVNCNLEIGKLCGSTVENEGALVTELAEIDQQVSAYMAGSTQTPIPLSVLLLRLRALVRGYNHHTTARAHVKKLCVKIVSNPRFYQFTNQTDFLQDVAYHYGKEIEQLSPFIVPNVMAGYGARGESATLMLVAFATTPATLSALLRYITQQLYRNNQLELVFKQLMVICLKPELNDAHHINIRHVLDQSLKSHNEQYTHPATFILQSYARLHSDHAEVLVNSLPSPVLELVKARKVVLSLDSQV